MGAPDYPTEFIEGTTFEGVRFPRFDGQPNGPKLQSMVLCKCGEFWKYHRLRDGACPVQKGDKK
jgi:hypothetical protein